ncbi:MAG: N-carbamoyl-D-amino-acid hydrolase [Proteobacteria bacterium]|nr:N-carbamoyl-D-amino-acid hydrolase [Pseudomonadota bacterium]
MSRVIVLGAAQLGPIARAEARAAVVERLIALLRRADERGCTLVVFPELALTTFFPRFWLEDESEIDSFFETEMPGPATKRLFEAAAGLGIGFYLGYGELARGNGAVRRYNASILVDRSGRIVGRYRKVHLPGAKEYDAKRRRHNFEKRYFEVGNLGFPVWRTMGGVMGMCLCNDRRWPETFRVMGLQGVELVMLGYNTGEDSAYADEPAHVRMMQNHLCLQAGAYQNATWVCGVAKAGLEEGQRLMGGSAIVAPSGEIVAQAHTLGDEVIVAECDLDECNLGKSTMFNFAAHRRIEHYRLIAERAGAVPPPEA